MDPLILFHWLVKGHNKTMMGKEAGSGGGSAQAGGVPGVKLRATRSLYGPAALLGQDARDEGWGSTGGQHRATS